MKIENQINHYLTPSTFPENTMMSKKENEMPQTRSQRVKRGALNGIKTTDPLSVRLGMGGPLELIPGLRDINPVGFFRRAWGRTTHNTQSVTTTPASTATNEERARELPGFRRIVYQGQDAWVRQGSQDGLYDLYFLDHFNNPQRAGTVYQSQNGEWHCAGLCGGADSPSTPSPIPGPSHAQNMPLQPGARLTPIIQSLNQTIHAAQEHANAIQLRMETFVAQITAAHNVNDNNQLFLLVQELPRHIASLRELHGSLENTRVTLSNARHVIRTWRDRHPDTTVTQNEITHYLDEINNRIFNQLHLLITQTDNRLQHLMQLQTSLSLNMNEE